MDQVVPVLEASPMVFRYAWFASCVEITTGAPRHLGRPTPSMRLLAVAASVQT